MKRRLLLLNIVLVAMLGWIGWQIRLQWVAAREREQMVLLQKTRLEQLAPLPPIPRAEPFPATNYYEVAQKFLFSPDRNPNVVIEPEPEKAKPAMPPLPSFHGLMNFGEPTVILGEGVGRQKSYRAGEQIGAFKVVSFDRVKIIFEWEGETVERALADLKSQEAAAQQQSAPVAQVPAATQIKPSTLSPGSVVGADMGAGFRGCVMGDTTPAGTIVEGYRKVVSRGLMGESCHWEQTNK